METDNKSLHNHASITELAAEPTSEISYTKPTPSKKRKNKKKKADSYKPQEECKTVSSLYDPRFDSFGHFVGETFENHQQYRTRVNYIKYNAKVNFEHILMENWH
mmetsp:Transcript_13901/g.11874  ORF Transcript_13901/g.11874 Transcript_13901/m.11874 type:complete len:105 (+) Transcript_13901:601-915(+)